LRNINSFARAAFNLAAFVLALLARFGAS